jgi:SAM-dependent methyltransferase
MSAVHRNDQPSAWVQRFAALMPPGEVLDLACGYGRHARLFAAAGHSVLAVDRDSEALLAVTNINEQGISTLQVDLENGNPWPFEKNRFAGIVIANYLHRPLFPFIFDSLADDGILIIETFAVGNGQFGKPSNPDFLLAPGELLALAGKYADANLRIIAYEDGYVSQPQPAMIQRISLVKGTFCENSRRFPLI